MTTTPSFADHVFLPWRAEADRRVVASESHWREPVAWNKIGQSGQATCECPKRLNPDMPWHLPGCPQEERSRVLVGCEVFEGPELMSADSWDSVDNYATYRTWATIWCTPHIDWLIATDYPENIKGPSRHTWAPGALANATGWVKEIAGIEEAQRFYSSPWPPANLWLGVIISTQAEADAHIPALLKVPAAKRWVWARGVTEDIDLRPKAPDCYSILGKHYHSGLNPAKFPYRDDRVWNCFPKIDRLVISGSIGPDAPTTDVAHLRSIVRQGQSAGVSVWVDGVDGEE